MRFFTTILPVFEISPGKSLPDESGVNGMALPLPNSMNLWNESKLSSRISECAEILLCESLTTGRRAVRFLTFSLLNPYSNSAGRSARLNRSSICIPSAKERKYEISIALSETKTTYRSFILPCCRWVVADVVVRFSLPEKCPLRHAGSLVRCKHLPHNKHRPDFARPYNAVNLFKINI